MPLSPETLKTLAARGAALRYAELTAERDALVATFPALAKPPRPVPHDRVYVVGPTGHARRTMSPAQRKAISLRMSKYWAAKRVEKVKAAVSAERRKARAKNGK
jgi:hypothetical protein